MHIFNFYLIFQCNKIIIITLNINANHFEMGKKTSKKKTNRQMKVHSAAQVNKVSRFYNSSDLSSDIYCVIQVHTRQMSRRLNVGWAKVKQCKQILPAQTQANTHHPTVQRRPGMWRVLYLNDSLTPVCLWKRQGHCCSWNQCLLWHNSGRRFPPDCHSTSQDACLQDLVVRLVPGGFCGEMIQSLPSR